MVFQSPYPDVDIPHVDFWGFMFDQKNSFAEEKMIFINPETSLQCTYRDVKNTSIAFGHALEKLWSWQQGDVLTPFAPSCIETPIVYFGALWAAGVVSPVNPAYTASELAFQLKNSELKGVLTVPALSDTAFEAAKLAGIPLDRIIVMGDGKFSRTQHLADFNQSAAHLPKSRPTTGLPKGVCLTQRNMVVNLLQIETTQTDLRRDGGLNGEGDIVLSVLPFYHVYGLSSLIHRPLYAGIKTVVLPKFDLDIWCRTVQNYKITYAYVVPPILLGLSKAPLVDRYDLTSITMLVSAAAPLTKQIVYAVWDRLKIPTKQAYGLSETSPATHLQQSKEWKTTVGSVGKLLPNQTGKFVSETEDELPEGSVGELWVRGPNVFAGYWKSPSATAACITSDGFSKTGDIGYEDKDENRFITDRLKEMIKYKGFQIAPAELEGILVESNLVGDACVVGLYDESKASEVPLAFVVKTEEAMKKSDNELEKEICRWLASRIADHKRLKGGIRFVDEIPKSAAGKILRRLLRDQIKAEVARKESKSRL